MLFQQVIFIFLALFHDVNGETFLNYSKILLNDLLSDYQKYVRPVNNARDTVNVTVQMYLRSIQELDEVQERLSYVARLSVVWHDAGMVWVPSQYGGVNTVSVLWDEVWTPDLLLINAAKEIKSLGLKEHTVDYYNDGLASLFLGYLLETSCSVNARNYPFDTQSCTTVFQIAGSNKGYMDIQAGGTEVNIKNYAENSAWTLVKTKAQTDRSNIYFTLYLKRKSDFVMINIILPILFLGLLNVLVFVMVPESGERVSFCITVLLAIAVFMTIVSDTLPKSSEPVPIISYKLMADMILSSLITVVTIFNLGIYNKLESKPKPKWIIRMYTFVYHHRCSISHQVIPLSSERLAFEIDDKAMKSKNTSLTITEENDLRVENLEHLNQNINPQLSSDDVRKPPRSSDWSQEKSDFTRTPSPKPMGDTDVTWKDISRLIDMISLVCFTFALLSSVVIFTLMTATA